jgi:hypothetical protein
VERVLGRCWSRVENTNLSQAGFRFRLYATPSISLSLSPPVRLSPSLSFSFPSRVLFIDDTAPRLAFFRSPSFDAMILQRYSRFVDGTIPVAALLYDDEENYASQDSVGIYDG